MERVAGRAPEDEDVDGDDQEDDERPDGGAQPHQQQRVAPRLAQPRVGARGLPVLLRGGGKTWPVGGAGGRPTGHGAGARDAAEQRFGRVCASTGGVSEWRTANSLK